ncbi:MAG: hypothetical protein HY006_01655 [Candidatus Sungbacteria bacterium]|nr:hypothetical protein [Candidatus Sungbacteria bacterium]
MDKGSVRYIVFQDKGDNAWYAAALEFNIVESGDDPRQALFGLFEAIRGYAASARNIKTRLDILNQKPDPEYEKMWNAVEEAKNQRGVPYTIFTAGRQIIPA